MQQYILLCKEPRFLHADENTLMNNEDLELLKLKTLLTNRRTKGIRTLYCLEYKLCSITIYWVTHTMYVQILFCLLYTLYAMQNAGKYAHTSYL